MKDNELKMRMKSHSEKMKNSIDSPFDITAKIDEMERCSVKNKNVSFGLLKKTMYSAACIAAAFVLMFNCIPSLAYAVSDIPILGDVVRVVTFGRFEVQEGGYEAKVVTPKVEGLLNKELEEKLNKEFQENANAIICAFEKDVKELKKAYGDDFYLGVEANYTVRTDNEDILAIDNYIVNTMASSSTKHSFYNIDKKTGTLIELESLFKKDADYVTPISEYIINEMRKQNEEGTGYFWVDEDEIAPFKKIEEAQKFFINDNGNIVICFDKYEVAAGAQGCPEFEIPYSVIASIIK
ncbi:MAG: DUF3298 domain-containing protein [Eubacteriales bacterium]|nr:DUF3298 domain-containing protein [Eubacteriales bacterium]